MGTITNCCHSAKDAGHTTQVTAMCLADALAEGRKLEQVVVGNSFHGMSRLAPGAQAAGDDEYFESELL